MSVTATETGPTTATIGAVETLVSGVPGITSTSNLVAAVPGTDIETDSETRARGDGAAEGSTTEASIYTRLVDREDVEHAVVTSNRSGETDANGTPPHTYWIVLYPDTGNQQEIAETIWGENGTCAGIGFRGAVTATVTDTNGVKQQLAWDWAVTTQVYAGITLTVDDTYPGDGDDLVKAAIEAFSADFIVGQRVDPSAVSNAYFDEVPGIVADTVTLKQGSAPGPGDTGPVVVAVNELPQIQAVNITVTSTPLS